MDKVQNINLENFESFLKALQVNNDCFLNPKIISMLTVLASRINDLRIKMFDLNSFSNVANVSNTNLMSANYSVLVFLLENLHRFKKHEINQFLSNYKFEENQFIDPITVFKSIKYDFLICEYHDYTEEQLKLF
jgi:hypothetical protein